MESVTLDPEPVTPPVTQNTNDASNQKTTTTTTSDGISASEKPKSPIRRFDTKVEKGPPLDTVAKAQLKLIQETPPTSALEIALSAELGRKNIQIEKLTSEIIKLKQFISKRKQTYKRKRKEDGAPTRALSAYNIFVQERFEQLAKQNEEALMSSNTDKALQRVPPASLVAQAGNEWRELPPEQKEIYKERAKADKKRYEEEMQKYNPPENHNQGGSRKRPKTGYNLFFSEFVDQQRQKQHKQREENDKQDRQGIELDGDVDVDNLNVDNLEADNLDVNVDNLEPNDWIENEHGNNLAKIVGNAWKALTSEERDEYERKADKMNESEDFSPPDEESERKQKSKKDVDAKESSIHVDSAMRLPKAPVVHQPGGAQHDHLRSPYPPVAAPPPPPPHGHYYPPYPYDFYPPMHMPPPPPPSTGAAAAPGKDDHHGYHPTSQLMTPRHHIHPFHYPPMPPPPHYMHPHHHQHHYRPPEHSHTLPPAPPSPDI